MDASEAPPDDIFHRFVRAWRSGAENSVALVQFRLPGGRLAWTMCEKRGDKLYPLALMLSDGDVEHMEAPPILGPPQTGEI